MSVYLNSTPQEDGAALTGGATVVGALYPYNVVAYREETLSDADLPAQYLALTAGGQYVGVWDRNGTYLEPGDTGFTFRWKIWARGTGTLNLTQDTDPPSWDLLTLPAASIGSLAVSAVDWTLYHVTAGPIVLADFLDYAGIRLGLDLASGAIDITTIQLECVPSAGSGGGWVDQAAYDVADLGAICRGSRTDVGAITVWSSASPDVNGEAALDATIAADILNSTGLDGGVTALITAQAGSWYRTGEDELLGPYGSTNMSAAYFSVDTTGDGPFPMGVEGVDYIRIPGYTVYDSRGLVRSAADRDNQPTSSTAWDTPYIVYQRDLIFGGDPTLNNAVVVYLGDYVDPTTTTTGFTPPGSPIHTITSSDSAIDTDPVILPSSGQFTVWIMSRQLTTTVGGAGGVVPGVIDQVEYLDGVVTVQSDPLGEVNEHKPLTYTIHYDPYSVWKPSALLTKLRQNQRGDGLGRSPRRGRGHQSRQASNRQRDYR